MGTDGMGERRNKELAERGGEDGMRTDRTGTDRTGMAEWDRLNGKDGMGMAEWDRPNGKRLGCPQVLIIC